MATACVSREVGDYMRCKDSWNKTALHDFLFDLHTNFHLRRWRTDSECDTYWTFTQFCAIMTISLVDDTVWTASFASISSLLRAQTTRTQPSTHVLTSSQHSLLRSHSSCRELCLSNVLIPVSGDSARHETQELIYLRDSPATAIDVHLKANKNTGQGQFRKPRHQHISNKQPYDNNTADNIYI